jgi:hypothetical protein
VVSNKKDHLKQTKLECLAEAYPLQTAGVVGVSTSPQYPPTVDPNPLCDERPALLPMPGVGGVACTDQPPTNTPYQQECQIASLVEQRLLPVPTDTKAENRPKKYTSITRRSRLLCPDGCGMQRVSRIDYLPLPWTVITLACGHVRGEVLPTQGNSFEHIRSEEGLRLFPPDLMAECIWGKR